MNATQTITSLVQTGRRWVMIGIALMTIGLSAPSALADHMGNHQRPLEESTPTTGTCSLVEHEDADASDSVQHSLVIGRPAIGRPW